jgi:hypothetical protein
MQIHMIGTARGIRASVIAALFALLIAAGVLAVQMTSIWSTTTWSPIEPASSSLNEQQYAGSTSSGHIRIGRVGAVRYEGR